MATHITQNEYSECNLLSVSGEMLLDDALLLERIASDLHESSEKPVTIDLADLDFLDSDSAAVLRRLAGQPGFRIEGMEIFLQSVVNEVEKR
jgi:anti-anti-sigma regulatory factor